MRNIQPYTIEMAYGLIKNRKSKPTANSYASKLMAQGTPAIAQRLGEQALETVIAAMQQNSPHRQTRLAEESADLLYHLLVLWADQGLEPQDVYDLLASRMSQASTTRAA
jgi:phosphoribosyl-ATP pyrophosphohydrolase